MMLNARSTEPNRRPGFADALGQPAGVEAVVDAQVRDQPVGQRGRHGLARLTSDECNTTVPGSRAAASTKRNVASNKYGATKTTLGTGPGQYRSVSPA